MSKWFIPHDPSKVDASVRIFCFPYAGGGAAAFRGLQKIHSGVVVVEYPGRESRFCEKPAQSMNELADAVVDEIAPYTDRPYILLGHSLGARVAYEVACRLRDRGCRAPECLVVAASRTPQSPERHPIWNLDDENFLKGIVRYNATPREILENREILNAFLPMLRADFTISETWIAPDRKPLGIPVSAFCGESDPEVSVEDMRSWKGFTSSSFAMPPLPGGHFFLFSQPDRVSQLLKGDYKTMCQ